MPIYLLDHNEYVSRYNIIKKSDNKEELITYIIENLTESDTNDYLPNEFSSIIPKGTKLLDKSIDEDLVKLNFSKEFLTISKDKEEKLIESIVYSILEIEGIKKVMIFVEGENLLRLPHSNKSLPTTLDKNIGINKTYNLKSLKEINKTTTYYLGKYDDNYYYIPVTSLSNDKKEKIEVIIEKLKSSPIYETNLISFLTSSTELLEYEILENSVMLSFNNHILNLDDGKISEEVKYSIALSVRDSYDINQTMFYVNDNLIDAFNIN